MTSTGIKGYEQYLHENFMWEKTLDYYLLQNAFLKTRLSQTVDKTTGKELVPQAEYFQGRFIENDEQIRELQTDADSLQRLYRNGDPDENKLLKIHRRLNNEINNFERIFSKLKADFILFMQTGAKV